MNLALEKIEKGVFGRCEHCDGEIGTKRLHALPFARLCIQCRQAEEQKNAWA